MAASVTVTVKNLILFYKTSWILFFSLRSFWSKKRRKITFITLPCRTVLSIWKLIKLNQQKRSDLNINSVAKRLLCYSNNTDIKMLPDLKHFMPHWREERERASLSEWPWAGASPVAVHLETLFSFFLFISAGTSSKTIILQNKFSSNNL